MRGVLTTFYLLLALASTVVMEEMPSSEAMKRRCEAGKADDCFNLAFMHEYGVTDKVACDGGVLGGPSCYRPGLLYMAGAIAGVPKDLPKAGSLYKQACEGGVLQACLNAGVMFDTGLGGAKDPVVAATFFRKACDGGLPPACSNLGAMYERGEGVQRDLALAAALYKKGCDGQAPGAIEN